VATQNNAAPSHQNPANWIRNGKPHGPMQGHATVQVVDEAVRFMEENRNRPFALFVTFHAPHEPISTPPDVASMYAGFQNPTQPQYYGSVSLVDREVGRLRGAMREMGLDRNTLVLFSSDNGPETLKRYPGSERSHGSPGPLRGMKLHLYEGGHRVPGILTGPGIAPGTTSNQPAGLIDILPTFSELSDAPLPKQRPIDGASIVPLLRGKTISRRQPLYWEYDSAISRPWLVALRDGDWKILTTPDFTRFEVYNLRQDMREQHNLASDEPERAASLLAKARVIRESVRGH
jgi:arylsulfatase A